MLNNDFKALMLVLISVLLCGGCQDINTDYGALDGDSVNGFTVVDEVWTETFAAQRSWSVNDRIERYDLLIHLQRFHANMEDEAVAYIEDWLRDGDQRQAVLVLRNESIAPWLLKRWADEINTAIQEGAADEEKLRKQEELLRVRADEEFSTPYAQTVAGCDVLEIEPELGATLTGPLGGMPTPVGLRGTTTITGLDVQPLVVAGNAVIMAEIPYGESRMIVCATGLPLLDAALVDKSARTLLTRLTDHIKAWEPDTALWIDRMWYREYDPPQPNILNTLFAKPPFAIIAWHMLALLVLYVWMRGAWLGRTTPDPDHHTRTLSGHIHALAWHLRHTNAWRQGLERIAKSQGEQSPSVTSSTEALTEAQRLLGDRQKSPSPDEEQT